MNRSDTLRAIAAHVRKSHITALFVVGWFAASSPQEELDKLLEAIHEVEVIGGAEGHLAAYAERWGRLPDGTGH
jgi:hypothetical protein